MHRSQNFFIGHISGRNHVHTAMAADPPYPGAGETPFPHIIPDLPHRVHAHNNTRMLACRVLA